MINVSNFLKRKMMYLNSQFVKYKRIKKYKKRLKNIIIINPG
jgi:hypothetical protein